MKKILLLFIAALSISYISAQETKNENIQTLFSKNTKVRGYIGTLTTGTTLDGDEAYMNGMQAAGIFNDHFVLGLYRLNLENNVFSNNDTYINSRIDFAHKGIILGYIFMPKRIIHFNTNVQLGKGNLEIYDSFADRWIEDDFVFVATPSLEVEFNVAKFLRASVGANYRFTFDVDKFNNYKDEDFSDFGAFVTLKFGWFR